MKKLLLSFIFIFLLIPFCFGDTGDFPINTFYKVFYLVENQKKVGFICRCEGLPANHLVNCCWDDYEEVIETKTKEFKTKEDAEEFANSVNTIKIVKIEETIEKQLKYDN